MDFGGASFEAPRSEKSAQIPKKNRIGLMWKSVNPILYTDGLQSLPGTGVFSTANFHFLMRGQMSSFFFEKAAREGVLLGPDIFKAESFSPTAWLF